MSDYAQCYGRRAYKPAAAMQKRPGGRMQCVSCGLKIAKRKTAPEQARRQSAYKEHAKRYQSAADPFTAWARTA